MAVPALNTDIQVSSTHEDDQVLANSQDPTNAPSEKLDKLAQIPPEILELLNPDEIERLHENLANRNEAPGDSKLNKDGNIWKDAYENFSKSSDLRNIIISAMNALLHGAATITLFNSNTNSPSELSDSAKFFDKAAFIFTRYIAPLSSYGFAAINSFVQDRDLIKTFIKLIPPVMMNFAGDANIDAVLGASTALNQPYDMVVDRLKKKKPTNEAHRNFVDSENNGSGKNSFQDNAKLVFAEFKSMLRDFTEGKLKWWDAAVYLVNCPMILLGSVPMLMFAPKERDTVFAKASGLLRNAGGLLGDFGFLRHKDPDKKTIGILCSLGALSDITKRWVKNETLAKIFIHLAAALNVTGMTVWNAFSEKQNRKQAA